MSDSLTFVMIFLLVALTDAIWTLYIDAVESRRAAVAAWWSMLLVGWGAIVVVEYVHKPWLIIAAVLGSFCGTYLSVKFLEGKK